MLFLSGHVPFKEDMKNLHVGKVGVDYTTEQAADLARLIGLELISTLKASIGELDRVCLDARLPPSRFAPTARGGPHLHRLLRQLITPRLQTSYAKVKKIVKIVGFVNCNDDYKEQPEVINGCSNLLGEVGSPAHANSHSSTARAGRPPCTASPCV
jgi:enamine deaminase RidA (YjgF/YER057c/UK114 family)